MRAAGRGAGALEAEGITTLAALERLQPEWQRLWSRSPRATPFQSPHWLLPWWKHIGRGSLASIAVRTAATGALVGFAPLYLFTDPATARRHLFPLGIATSDVLDALVAPGWEEAVLRCLAARLGGMAAQWDLLEFAQLASGSPLLRLPLPAGWRTEIADGEPSPVLALPAARPGTLPIPRRMADNIRHGRSRAARAGVLAYELADAGSIPALLAALVRLHTRRWSLRGLPGVLGDASVAAALGEATPLLHAAGLLRLHGLRLDGELIAVLYCLADAAGAAARHCYYYIGGFDPRCAAFSPGTLLIAQAIEAAAAEGAAAFDFLRGGEAYKYRWGAVDQPMRTLRAWHDAPDRANHG